MPKHFKASEYNGKSFEGNFGRVFGLRTVVAKRVFKNCTFGKAFYTTFKNFDFIDCVFHQCRFGDSQNTVDIPGCSFVRCHFSGCRVSLGTTPTKGDARFEGCLFEGGTIQRLHLRNSTLSEVRITSDFGWLYLSNCTGNGFFVESKKIRAASLGEVDQLTDFHLPGSSKTQAWCVQWDYRRPEFVRAVSDLLKNPQEAIETAKRLDPAVFGGIRLVDRDEALIWFDVKDPSAEAELLKSIHEASSVGSTASIEFSGHNILSTDR